MTARIRAKLAERAAEHTPPPVTPVSQERHFSPAQIADRWGVSKNTIVALFADEPGVLPIPVKYGLETRVALRIPESAVERLHSRLTGL